MVITLCLMVGGMGCEKEKSNTDIIKQKLIGKWKWEVSYGGAVGISKPIPGEKLVMEFTDERVLSVYNGEVRLYGSYAINEESDRYFITFTPDSTFSQPTISSSKSEFSFSENFTQLGFSFFQGTAKFSQIFKRINN